MKNRAGAPEEEFSLQKTGRATPGARLRKRSSGGFFAESRFARLSRQQLPSFRSTATPLSDIPVRQTYAIHRLFERIAEQRPHACAVITADEQLTYGELNRRANQLAHYLRASGAGPEVRIGICAGRSSRMVVAILGVLKSGAAYVPLDPAYPEDRLGFMARDAGLALLLVENRTADTLGNHHTPVLNLERDRAEVEQRSARNVDEPSVDDRLAYVIYTSGSTGTPRGVMITHANLCHYVRAIRLPIGLTSEDVYLHTASFSFSSSVRQFLVPLSHGATLVVASSEQIREPLALLEAVKRHAVTIMDLVPAYWRSCTHALSGLEPGKRAALLDNQLRVILSASEPLLSDLPRIWASEFGCTARCVNMFGQTETTGIVSCYPIRPEDGDGQIRVVSIGRAIANTEIHLLDRGMQPVPVDTPGEIYIGGGGIGRGYLNRPELTAKRFVRDPFNEDADRRLYRTGDLGRCRPDGNIEFLGRLDQQVKIRGSRVELGEIEAVLAEHPAIAQGIVAARKRPAGDMRLVAYLVPVGSGTPSTDELRRYLKSKLPDHMVPAAYLTLERLPLTATGKIDRRALPDAPDQRGDLSVPYVRARNPLEHVLVQIWEELLNVRPVGVHDNFFDLGGDSLLAVQMLLRVAEATGTRLSIERLFDDASVEHIAEALVYHEELDFRSPIITLQAGESLTPIFFDSGDYHGGGFYCLNLARHLGPDQPFYLLKSHGLDGGHVPRTIEEMATAYLSTLRAFRPKGPYILGGFCNGGLTTFEMARRLQADGEAVELVILIEAVAPTHRFRRLHGMIQRFDLWVSLDPERAIRWHYNLRHYDTRLEELGHMASRDRAAFIRNWIIRRVKAFRSRPTPSRAVADSTPRPEASAAPAPSNIDESTVLAYRRAVAGFIPRPYQGRVVLLRAAEAPLLRPDDPTLGWCRVAPDCEVHVIPGGHVTALTRNIEAVAEALEATLRRIR